MTASNMAAAASLRSRANGPAATAADENAVADRTQVAAAWVDRAPARPTPDLSVIVVTHNRTDLALETLRSAHANTGDVDVEWLVVDSGSSDDTPAAIERSWPEVHVERLPNVGFAAANNRGLAVARGRYVLLLNPDCSVVAGTLAELVAALDAQQHIGIASVVQRAPDGSLQRSIRRYPSPGRALGEAFAVARWTRLDRWQEDDARRSSYVATHSADWLVGAFLIARASAVREVGPLDERFFLYSEETDWCYRFRRAGWDVCHLPSMTITHHTGGEYGWDTLAQLSWAKILFARKHYGSVRASAIALALALRHFLRAAVGACLGPIKPAWRTRRAVEWHALSVVLARVDPPFAVPPTIEVGVEPTRDSAP